MKPVCYLSPDELLVSRDIDKKDYWCSPDLTPDVQNALPTSLLLFDSLYRDGFQLVLDVQENMPALNRLCLNSTVLLTLGRFNPN